MIPLTIPELSGNEWKYVKECLDTGWVSMAGAYVDNFEKVVSEYTGTKIAVAAVNGTCALDIALQLAGVKANDYVIVPNITFIASANSVKYQNANPILIDVDQQTWQMDLDLLERYMETETEIRNGHSVLKSNGRIIQVPGSRTMVETTSYSPYFEEAGWFQRQMCWGAGLPADHGSGLLWAGVI